MKATGQMSKPSLQPNQVVDSVNSVEVKKLKKSTSVHPSTSEDIARMSTDKMRLQSDVEAPSGTEPVKIQSDVEAPPGTKPVKIKEPSIFVKLITDVIYLVKDSKTGKDLTSFLNDMPRGKAIPMKAAAAMVLNGWDKTYFKFLSRWMTPSFSLQEIGEMNKVTKYMDNQEFNDDLVTAFENRAARVISKVFKQNYARRNQAARMIASVWKRYIASRPVKARTGRVTKDRCWDYMDPIQKKGESSPDNLPDYIVLSMNPKIEDISRAHSRLLEGYTEKVKLGNKTFITKFEPQRLIDEAEQDPESVSKREAAENVVKEVFLNGFIFITCKCRKQNHCVSFPYLKHTLSDTGKLRNISDIYLTGPKVPTQNVVSMPDLEVKCEKDSDSKAKGCNRKYALGNVIDFFRILALRFREFPYGGAVVREIDAFIERLERCKIDVIKAKNGTLASSCPKQGCPCASGFLRPREAFLSLGRWRYKDPEKFVICPEIGCGEQWCTLCGPEHTDPRQPCDHRRNFLNHPEREYFEEQIASGNLQKCPHCWHLQDRKDGCSKMICGSCDNWYCHDCGDSISKSGDYVADHLFSLSGRDTLRGNSMPCRRMVVKEAMMGNQKMVRQIVESHHRLLIGDFFHILENESSLDVAKIPGHLLNWARASNASPEQRNELEKRLRAHS